MLRCLSQMFKLVVLFFSSVLFSQNNIYQNTYELAEIKLKSELSLFAQGLKSPLTRVERFNIVFSSNYLINHGHPNLDNNSELYALGRITKLNSARFIFSNKWLIIEAEPYQLISSTTSQNNLSADKLLSKNGTFAVNNNTPSKTQNSLGLKQSRILVHFHGLGFSYGKMSHWWGPGFHTSIALSSNAPSQKTFSFGTFRDLRFGNFSLNSQIIAMPYNSSREEEIYFTGLKIEMGYNSDPGIRLGLNRTYLSANFKQSFNLPREWTLEDAVSLVYEPLFGQSKKDLDYTIPGTPGFDLWDEILSGYLILFFPINNFQIYLNVASDDNRANLVDLRAHWDHTLSYLIGFKKFTKISKMSIFTGIEYFTSRVSNTFKAEFYRGQEPPNFYSKPHYDYFSFNGRRMGAHSGSSSDDLIFKFGVETEKTISFFLLTLKGTV